jgi:hypothetical protein
MTKIEIDSKRNKNTKNFDRFKFDIVNVSRSVYLSKGVNKTKVTPKYE